MTAKQKYQKRKPTLFCCSTFAKHTAKNCMAICFAASHLYQCVGTGLRATHVTHNVMAEIGRAAVKRRWCSVAASLGRNFKQGLWTQYIRIKEVPKHAQCVRKRVAVHV